MEFGFFFGASATSCMEFCLFFGLRQPLALSVVYALSIKPCNLVGTSSSKDLYYHDYPLHGILLFLVLRQPLFFVASLML